MSPKTFNVGVIGYGFSAKTFHIPFITAVPELKLYAVVQRTPKADDNAENDHPGIKSYRSTEDMVKDPNVDLVVVTTAPDSHLSLTKTALEAGKNVIVEKPFTPTYQEAEELIKLAKQKKVLLSVYQNRRWDADFVTVSKLVGSGALGRIVEFESHFDRHRPDQPTTDSWKTKVMPGGSSIYDLGTHLMDQVVNLLGTPKRITGFVGSQRQNNTSGYEDSFTVLLHYDEGVMATVKAAVVSPEENQLRFWVRGVNGSYKKYHLDIQEDQLKGGMKPLDNEFGREPSDRYGTLATIKDGKPVAQVAPTVDPPTWTEYYRAFARALAGQGEVPVRAEDAASVIRLVELARESTKSGKTLDVPASSLSANF